MMQENKRIQRIMEIKIKKVHTLLDLVISAVAYVQLYDVAENRFDPATQLVELKGDKARKLIAQL